MTQTVLDSAVKGPTFHPISSSRKIKNSVATVLFWASFVIAMVPLVWVLYTVVERGFRAMHLCRRGGTSRWPACCPSSSPAASTTRSTARSPGRDRRACLRCRWASWRPSTWSNTAADGSHDDDLHGRHPRRCAVDRGRAVHLRLVDRDNGFPAERLRRLVGTGVADAPGRGAQHRGDAQAGSRRAARSVVRVGHSEMEDHRADRRAHCTSRHHQRHPAGAGPGDR